MRTLHFWSVYSLTTRPIFWQKGKNKQDTHCTYNVTLRRVRVTIFAVEKQYVVHIMSVYLWPKVPSSQYACAILSSMTCPAPQYFSTLSHTLHYFRKQKLLNIKCVFWFSLQLLSEIFLIQWRIWRDILHIHWPSCTVTLLLSEFNETWIFSTINFGFPPCIITVNHFY